METSHRTNDDDEGGALGDKLIPEWRVGADDQVVLAGLAVVAAMALLFLWNLWRGDDGELDLASGTTLVEAINEEIGGPTVDGDADAGVVAPVIETTTTTEAATTTEQESTTTTEAAPIIGDVQAAVSPLPGAITGTNDGTTAVLEGFVANQAESDAAEEAAAAVEGIESVENNLVLLEPAVTEALGEAGVVGATSVGVGTEITVSGTIESEDARQPALDAAAAVAGVTNVIDDRLNVSVTADLNALPQVQFRTGSAEILPASFEDLNAAAALIQEAGDVELEVQGYTDIAGDEADNLVLSQDRADAVRNYLIDQGVEAAILTAEGFGETEQFGDDLASNRVVRFEQVG